MRASAPRLMMSWRQVTAWLDTELQAARMKIPRQVTPVAAEIAQAIPFLRRLAVGFVEVPMTVLLSCVPG